MIANELTAGQSTFAPGMRLLPRDVRRDVARLYHVLRTLDDLVDEDDPRAPARVDAVVLWAQGAGAGPGLPDGETSETTILNELEGRYTLSRPAVLLFCEGMRHDIGRGIIHNEEDLARYCQQAGGSVGMMLASLLGIAQAEGETKMAVLGRAVQMTNILRDIDEDLAHGRVYIDRDTIDRYGAPEPGARKELVREVIARADALYVEGMGAIPMLLRGQRAVRLNVTLYREILRQIEREGFGRLPGRVTLPSWRRRLLTARQRLHLGIPHNPASRVPRYGDPGARRI